MKDAVQPGEARAEELLRRIRAVEFPVPPDLSLDPTVPPARAAYAAAHVAVRPGADPRAPVAERIDWESTIAFRRRLWSLGFGVAEAMDTAQRDVLGWEGAAALLDRTLAEARRAEATGEQAWPEVVGGAGTDGIVKPEPSLAELIDEYVRQAEFVRSRGGTPILLASPFMPRLHPEPEKYATLYREVARRVQGPIFVHWLGEMFAPSLKGYFPGDSFERIMRENADTIRGAKISLLDEEFEIRVRRRLAERGQVVLTGDDYNYARLIPGEDDGGRPSASGAASFEIRGRRFPVGDFSHALLGVFDAIAPVAARALNDLARGDAESCRRLLGSTEPLGRKLFEPPTSLYKAGVIFLAYLAGLQEEFVALGDLHLARSPEHCVELFRLAAGCGVFADPEAARERAVAWIERSIA